MKFDIDKSWLSPEVLDIYKEICDLTKEYLNFMRYTKEAEFGYIHRHDTNDYTKARKLTATYLSRAFHQQYEYTVKKYDLARKFLVQIFTEAGDDEMLAIVSDGDMEELWPVFEDVFDMIHIS